MSTNENAQTPVPHRFAWAPMPDSDGQPASKFSAVGQALGAASTCWEHMDQTGVFDSTRCSSILEGLMSYLASIEEPLLGLATTAQLLDELKARAEIGGYAGYRTVDAS